MSEKFLDTIKAGTKILISFSKGNIVEKVVKAKVVTIASIKHYNKDLYEVTFRNKNGNYCFFMAQLIKMKMDYESKYQMSAM